MSETYAQIIVVAKEQEAMLRFDHFTADDAWDLGVFLAARVRSAGIEMAISIRKLNGHILFQHCTQGTALNNQRWMNRKFNTVVLTEGSSLRAWASLCDRGQIPQDQGVNPEEYAYCGGGFPIRLTGGELVGAVIVSNLPHREDHRFIVNALADYLHKDNVPCI